MTRFKFLFYCTLLLSYLTNATQIAPYNTDLKIQTNPITNNKGTQYVVYTRIVEYDKVTTEFTDEELAGLCKQAYDEMKSMHAKWVERCKGSKDYLESVRPGMMSAIAIGYKIYFASSAKRNKPNKFLEHSNLRFTQDMMKCWASLAGPDFSPPGDGTGLHRTDANCGETQAAALYLAHNEETIQESGLTARMVAFGTDNEEVQKPCGTQADWEAGVFACITWAGYAKINWVKKGTVPKQVDKSPKAHHQVHLNTLWKIKEIEDADQVQGLLGGA